MQEHQQRQQQQGEEEADEKVASVPLAGLVRLPGHARH